MQQINLSNDVIIKTVSENETTGDFEIEGLYTGYGLTVGNSLRRVLLSSLPGAAITQFKIKGVGHEFSTLPGVVEDVVEISLNLKKIRFRVHEWEPQVLTLKSKGAGIVTAADIKANNLVEVISPDLLIATLTAKDAEFDMELTVEKGLGYVPLEARKTEKLPIGVVALDALFSPVVAVNFKVENMRVGDRTDYNRVKLHIVTDGSITPSSALKKTGEILQHHFNKFEGVIVKEVAIVPKTEKKEKGDKEKKVSKVKKK